MIRLFDLPHAEARRLLATGAPVWISINPVEYHGPHLSLHNDRLISEGLTVALHARLTKRHDWPLLVGCDIEAGTDPTPGPGSRNVPFSALKALVIETCKGLAELGAKRVVLMTFHGSPLHNLAIQEGVNWLRKLGIHATAPFNLVLRQQLSLDPNDYAHALAHLEDDTRADVLAGLRWDFHAGLFETSVTLHFAPHTVAENWTALADCPAFGPVPLFTGLAAAARHTGRRELAAEFEFAAMGEGWAQLRPFPGYTGRPSLATAEAGAAFAEAILDLYEPHVEAVLSGGEPERPIMQWAGPLTLWGRIPRKAAPHAIAE